MTKNNVIKLLKRYNAGNCSEAEKAIVEAWYADWNKDDRISLPEDELEHAELLMRERIFPIRQTKQIRLWPRIAAAASIILCLWAGGYLLFKKHPGRQLAQNPIHDIAPGGNKATLILSNGKKIVLADAHNGAIASQGKMLINKTQNGKIVYEPNQGTTANPGDNRGGFNTLITPRGGQSSVTLPDGTIAYLDAASSIKFPVNFNGNERSVEITGQVYFEVVHNATQPFKVVAKQQTIEDIGTHFNVMAYDDEKAVKTTLLEGAVKVSDNGLSKLLRPGQQAQSTAAGIKVVNNADMEDVVAWKNGYFKFNENLESIMAKISRWYDVEVVYDFKPNTDMAFGGKISRNKNISSVLKIMELTGNVHFKVEGRRVTVMK